MIYPTNMSNKRSIHVKARSHAISTFKLYASRYLVRRTQSGRQFLQNGQGTGNRITLYQDAHQTRLDRGRTRCFQPLNSQDLIVNSPPKPLNISLKISYENLVLHLDNNFHLMSLSIFITCFLYNVWLSGGEFTC